jgi:hypothetical protein
MVRVRDNGTHIRKLHQILFRGFVGEGIPGSLNTWIICLLVVAISFFRGASSASKMIEPLPNLLSGKVME